MRCIAFVRCAALVASMTSISLAVAAQAPAPDTLGQPDLPPEPTGILHLRDALAAALLRNPDLAADAFEVRAREAGLLQARAFTNPTVSVELEDFAGSGSFRGVESAQ